MRDRDIIMRKLNSSAAKYIYKLPHAHTARSSKRPSSLIYISCDDNTQFNLPSLPLPPYAPLHSQENHSRRGRSKAAIDQSGDSLDSCFTHTSHPLIPLQPCNLSELLLSYCRHSSTQAPTHQHFQDTSNPILTHSPKSLLTTSEDGSKRITIA